MERSLKRLGNSIATATLTLQTSSDGHFWWVNSREILFEVTVYQSQDFLRNLKFFSHLSQKKHWWHARLRKKKNLKFEKKLSQVWVWEKIYLVAQFGEKNSNFLRNLRFEKISALVAPKPGELKNEKNMWVFEAGRFKKHRQTSKWWNMTEVQVQTDNNWCTRSWLSVSWFGKMLFTGPQDQRWISHMWKNKSIEKLFNSFLSK